MFAIIMNASTNTEKSSFFYLQLQRLSSYKFQFFFFYHHVYTHADTTSQNPTIPFFIQCLTGCVLRLLFVVAVVDDGAWHYGIYSVTAAAASAGTHPLLCWYVLCVKLKIAFQNFGVSNALHLNFTAFSYSLLSHVYGRVFYFLLHISNAN